MLDSRFHHGLRYRRRRALLRRHHESARRRQGRPPPGLARLWRTIAAGASRGGLYLDPQGSQAAPGLGLPLVLQGEMAHPDRCVLGRRHRAGGSDDGPPGIREYHTSYYAAFLRIPTATGSRRSVIIRCRLSLRSCARSVNPSCPAFCRHRRLDLYSGGKSVNFTRFLIFRNSLDDGPKSPAY